MSIEEVNNSNYSNNSKCFDQSNNVQEFKDKKITNIINDNENSNYIKKNDINYEKEIRSKIYILKKLFEYYCQYGDKSNTTYLSISKYKKLINDSNLINIRVNKNVLHNNDIELIFSYITSNNSNYNKNLVYKKSKHLIFEEFLQSILLMSEKLIKYDCKDINNKIKNKENLKFIMYKIICNFLCPLYENKLNKLTIINNSKIKYGNINKLFNNKTLNLINDLSLVFYNIYSQYFYFELSVLDIELSTNRSVKLHSNNSKKENNILNNSNFIKSEYNKKCIIDNINTYDILVNKSKEVLIKLLKDFDINPFIINKQNIYLLYNEVISNENIILDCIENTQENSAIYDFEMYVKKIKEFVINYYNFEKSTTNYNLYEHFKYFGKVFSFTKFLLFIYLLSDGKLIIYDLNIEFLSQYDKLCLIIERIENSNGFIKLKKKLLSLGKIIKTPYNNNLLLPKEAVYRLHNTVHNQYNNINRLSHKTNETNINNNVNFINSISLFINNYKFSRILFNNISNYNWILNIYNHYLNLQDNIKENNLLKLTFYEKLLKYANIIDDRIESIEFNSISNKSPNKLNIKDICKSPNKKDFLKNYNKELNTTYKKYQSLIEESNNITNKYKINEHNKLDISKKNLKNKLKYKDIEQIFFKVYLEDYKITNNTNNTNNVSINIGSGINYPQFLLSLELIGLIMYDKSNLNTSLNLLFQNNLYPLKEIVNNYQENEKLNLNQYMEAKKTNSDFVRNYKLIIYYIKNKFILLFNSTLEPYYNYYKKNSKFLSFEIIKKILSDFEIFPDIISIKKLKIYYNYIVEGADNKNEYNFDLESLVDLLGVCAYDISFLEPKPDDISRLIFILKRISSSKQLDKVKLNIGAASIIISNQSYDILFKFKQYYPRYFDCNSSTYYKDTNLYLTNLISTNNDFTYNHEDFDNLINKIA